MHLKYIFVLTLLLSMTSVIGQQPTEPVNVPLVDVPNGGSVKVDPSQSIAIRTPSGTSINVKVGSNVTIKVTAYNSNPGQQLQNATALSLYLDITISNETVDVDAKITFDIKDALAAINASKYAFSVWTAKNSLSEWGKVNSGVSQSDGIVTIKTTHFSLWVVLLEPNANVNVFLSSNLYVIIIIAIVILLIIAMKIKSK